jgi:pimeloyl-ACP methyl ester carboxylesterase
VILPAPLIGGRKANARTVRLISARTAPAGGPVSNKITPEDFSPQSNRLVILIHGYNVNQANGEASYNAFSQLLQTYKVPEVSILGEVIGFLWPGDVDIKFIAGLFYPAKMQAARDSATRLAEFLASLRGPNGVPMQIMLVAHSLGNRVSLEMMTDLLAQSNRTWGRMEGYCLMAAAVVVGEVQNNGRLYPAISKLRTRTLFSESDKVLHWAFPSGETAAGAGFFPQAVGRFGNPVAIWNDRFDLQPYDHGNYFPGLQTRTGVDDRSAQYVAQFLGAAIPLPRAVNQITSNSLPPENNIPSRPIG